MKNLLIATAVAAILTSASNVQAADKPATLEQVLEQLQSLSKRVDTLETQNATLKQENETLKASGERVKAESDYLKSQTRDLRESAASAQSEISKVKGADWASRIAFKGDVRYRHEEIDNEVSQPERSRERIRVRAGLEAKATDTITVGVQFSTAENGDPRSTNQTLTGENTHKELDLDLAYLDWKFAEGADLILGKMKYSFKRPGQSVFYDGDINPEGIAVSYSRGMWFGTVYGYSLEERQAVAAGATCGEYKCSTDTTMIGGQFGANLALGKSTVTLAVQYYDLGGGQGKRPFYNNSSNGNTTTNVVIGGSSPVTSTAILTYDFNVIEAFAEFNTQFGTLPFQAWIEFAQNRDATDLKNAKSAGFMFGKASNYQTWEAGVAYQKIEKDALFAQFVDSDFGNGVTDTDGYVLRAGYAPRKNWTLNGTYFINKLSVDTGAVRGTDYNRLQLDFNVKF